MSSLRWFLAVGAILVTALLLESGLLAYAMYVLLGLLVVTRWLSRVWVDNLSARRSCRRDEHDQNSDEDLPVGGLAVEIGERVRVQLTLRNAGVLPIPWVLVEDALPRHAEDPRNPRLRVKGKRLQIGMLAGNGEWEFAYSLECLGRGYHQIGPLVLETGDLFGLHRRFKVTAEPAFVLVYPRVVPLTGYDLTSRRPIGDVRMTYRLFEDPTRVAGVRGYESGDPLNRVHWGATARTGQLHSKIYEPSTLSGITAVLDFHQVGYSKRGEPIRSELAITTVLALVNAVYEMGQQTGLVTNARDAVERIKTEGWKHAPTSRWDARATASEQEQTRRLEPLVVPTRRGQEQLQRIRELLARAELTDGLTLAELITETTHRLPRDATVLVVLPAVSIESAIALGNLKRRGHAVSVVLVLLDEDGLEKAYARLLAEGIRDLRHVPSEDSLPDLCRHQVSRLAPYDFAGLGV